MTRRVAGPRLTDGIDVGQLMLTDACPADSPDLVIDLCEDQTTRPSARTVRILYDGTPGETALMGALLAGRMPTIDIEEVETGAILATGTPCADNAGTILEAFECVLARVTTLLLTVMRNPAPLVPAKRSAHSIRTRSLVAFEAKTRCPVDRPAPLCVVLPYPALAHLLALRGRTGPLADRNPCRHRVEYHSRSRFLLLRRSISVRASGRSYVFVEDWDHRRNKAVISVVPFDESGPSGPARPVLEEPWHLSYPFLIAHDGEIWMIPESSASRSLTLYRADPFPSRWVPEAVLLSDIEASDATVIQHNGTFWMFAATRDGRGSWSDTLSIFHARDLRGPWKPTKATPFWSTRRPRGRPAPSSSVTESCGGRCRTAPTVMAPELGWRRSFGSTTQDSSRRSIPCCARIRIGRGGGSTP